MFGTTHFDLPRSGPLWFLLFGPWMKQVPAHSWIWSQEAPLYSRGSSHLYQEQETQILSFTHLTGMQAVETCWNTDLTLIKLIRKPLYQTMDGGHPPGALVAASGRESASDWVVSLGKTQISKWFSFRPTFRQCLSDLQICNRMLLRSYIFMYHARNTY